MNRDNYISPLRTQNLGERVNTDLPTATFDKPYQWLKDLVCTAVYAVGVVTIVAIAGVAVGYFYARFV